MIDINRPEELGEVHPEEINLEDFPEPMEELLENEDGSVEISLDKLVDAPQLFDENIAERLDEDYLGDMASDLLELIKIDKDARKKRDKQYEEGIRRTGLGDDAPGGASFSGASKAVHPVLAESCIDFAARAIKELFPANGPVRMETVGVLPPQEEYQVKKVAECLNHQFTKKIAEYRRVQEQKLTQLPLGGSQFIKLYPSMEKGRIVAEFVPVDNLFIPYYADSFYDAERITHQQFISEAEMDLRITNGQYRDVALIKTLTEPEKTASATASDNVEGKESSGTNEDGTRPVYEVYVWKEIIEDDFSTGSRSPYIITVDEQEETILSIRRNWDEQDPLRLKLDWIIEDMFIPWRGAYGIGLPHLIGGLSGAATGALRALLDSAHINNAPTLLKLKGSKMSGQTKQVDVTNIVEVEGPVGVDDIRKYLMTMPFNAPSPVLFQLLGWLTDAAKGVVSTASEKIADATSNTPVGTTQALIEQGAIIFSSIHSRLHFSQAKVFEVTLRILKQYFPEQLAEFELDPATVSMKGVHPVSDPNIFSEAQRMAQMQGVLALADKAPQLYNQPELHKNMLSLMKINNAERFLTPPPPQPQPMDPAAELLSFLQGAPVAVVPEQDHQSHIQIHLAYLQDPMMGLNPVMVPITAKVLEHLRDHLTHFFAARLQQAVMQLQQRIQQQSAMQGQRYQQAIQQAAVYGIPPQQASAMIPKPQMPQMPSPEAAMAQGSQQIIQQDSQLAQQAMEAITAADQFVKDHMQQQDPNMVAIMEQSKNQRLELERKIEKDAVDSKLANERETNLRDIEATEKLENKRVNDLEIRLKEQAQEHEQKMERLQKVVDLMKNDQDNKQHQLTELLKNHEDNETSVTIEKIRALVSAKPPEELISAQDYIDQLRPTIESIQNANSEASLPT
jgi:chaperonin GroES